MKTRRRILVGTYWIFVLTLCLIFIEVTVRLWNVRPTYLLRAQGISYALPFRLDEKFLFRFLPFPERSINSWGYRDREFSIPKVRRRIVVVGDSFPMGLAVEPAETFPKVLESLLPETEVLNLGVQGYGPDQELEVLRRHAISLKPDHIVLSLFPSNDYNDLIKNQLLKREGDGSLQAFHPNVVEATLPVIRSRMVLDLLLHQRFLPEDVENALQPALFRDSEAPHPVSSETIALMRSILLEFRNELKQKEISFTAVVFPSYAAAADPAKRDEALKLDRLTMEMCRDEGIEIVDLIDRFAAERGFYNESDHHLSLRGHRAAAERLLSKL